MSDLVGLPPPPPPPPLAVRIAGAIKRSRAMVDSCVRRRPLPGLQRVPRLTTEQARDWAEVITERATLVIEEWRRSKSPNDSQLVATALMSLKNTIENAAAVEEPVEPATADAGT